MEINILDPTCHIIFIYVRIPAWLPAKQTMHDKKIAMKYSIIIFKTILFLMELMHAV